MEENETVSDKLKLLLYISRFKLCTGKKQNKTGISMFTAVERELYTVYN